MSKNSKQGNIVKHDKIMWSPYKNVPLLVVNRGTSNFSKWKKEIQIYLYEHHRDFGNIIEFGVHKKFKKPSVDDVDSDSEQEDDTLTDEDEPHEDQSDDDA